MDTIIPNKIIDGEFIKEEVYNIPIPEGRKGVVNINIPSNVEPLKKFTICGYERKYKINIPANMIVRVMGSNNIIKKYIRSTNKKNAIELFSLSVKDKEKPEMLAIPLLGNFIFE